MKYHCMTVFALILSLKISGTDSSQECSKNTFPIIDENGAKIECLLCQKCTFGRGLTPPCGVKLTEAQKAKIQCVPCEPGKTYSDEHGPSSCKFCQICPVTLKNCTAESNTHCSKDCREGHYYDNSTYNCQPCSYCCREDNKRIAECADQPAQSQCSVHDALECSPNYKTTKSPSSTKDGGSNGGPKVDKTLVIAVSAVVVAVAVVIVVWLLLKRRKQRPTDHNTPEQVPLENRPNNCGITKLSFSIKMQPPFGEEVQEGQMPSLVCDNYGNDQDEQRFDNCSYIYDWRKDMNDYHCYGHNYKIDFNPVKVKDFGRYSCQVKCKQHPHQDPVEAGELDLDVTPGPNKRYKKFTEINSVEDIDKIGDMLKTSTPGIGDWKRVAERYGMEQLKMDTLENVDQRGKHVINYLKASQIELTVYDFCKFMKIIKQNCIVKLLEKHLTCKVQERQGVDTRARDSGYDHDDIINGAPLPSIENVPEVGGQNRQGSRDEPAASNSHNGKENPGKGNKKFDRQISNQSAKSSGSGSGSASNSVVRALKGFKRQISQNSTYKKHENEGGENPS